MDTPNPQPASSLPAEAASPSEPEARITDAIGGRAAALRSPRDADEGSTPLSDALVALVEQASFVSGGNDLSDADLLGRLFAHPTLRQAFRERHAQPQRLGRLIAAQIAHIDERLTRQLNAIVHHPQFQRLEASWRGLCYLHACMVREEEPAIKLQVLDASWAELERDFQRQVDFDQSSLFKSVYEHAFGLAGGEPFGVLIGDFEIRPAFSRDYRRDDLAVLRSIGQVAAAAFCPFISAASPAMFGFEDFSPLQRSVDLQAFFRDRSFFRWQKLREEEDARFLGLTLPRVLMRLPYEDDPTRVDGFCFREDVDGIDASKYLWGNASYALAAVLMRSFSQTRWFIDTRGVAPGVDGGGLVVDLPAACFATDGHGVALKTSTDVTVSETLERSLSELGFLPLCDCPDTEFSAFFSGRSIQQPQRFSDPEASASAEMSAMLQYMFCVSRLAHYLKVMARDWIGSLSTTDLEQRLNNWLAEYMCGADSSPEVKMRHPLESGRVVLAPEPGKAGSYRCLIELKPHFELEELTAAVRLSTQLTAAHR